MHEGTLHPYVTGRDEHRYPKKQRLGGVFTWKEERVETMDDRFFKAIDRRRVAVLEISNRCKNPRIVKL